MRGEKQVTHLLKMMQKHTLYPEYELALSPVQVKKNSLKKLSKGDILLLGLDSLKMILLDEGRTCATVVMDDENSNKVRIIQIIESTSSKYDSKKYETVLISFGMLQSRKLEVGHKISIASLGLEKITLVVEDKNIAKGSLVNVDGEIAVQIDEVRR